MKPSYLGLFAIGLLAGVAAVICRGDTGGTTPATSPPNVVQLKNEKLVTWDQDGVALDEVPDALARLAGRHVGIDQNLWGDAKYSFHLKAVPLSRVMDVLAYLADGVWVIKDGYSILRPRAAVDVDVNDPGYDALLKQTLAYFASTSPDDPSLPPGAKNALNGFRKAMQPDGATLPDNLALAMKDGTISSPAEGKISISYLDPGGSRKTLLFTFRHGRYQ